MLVVDRIHEDTHGLPSDIFLQSKMEINLENMRSHHMHEIFQISLSIKVTSPCFGPTLSIISANLDNFIQVDIPRQKSSQSFVTKMKCQVTSRTTHDVLISKKISYKSFKEICSGEKKKINLCYWGNWQSFKVENNSLLHYPPEL